MTTLTSTKVHSVKPLRAVKLLQALMPLTPLAAAIMAAPLTAMAASDSTTATSTKGKHVHHTYLEEIVVSASPLGKTASENPRPIAVLTGEQLRQQAAATLGETLQGQLGVSSASFGPGVGSPIIRGQGANRVKVMQDNLDTLDAANASADHANTIEPLLADSIEILRGPQTLRFGNGAIGGVVNVIDSRVPRKLPDGIDGAIETRHTSANDETASVLRMDGAASDNFAWHIDGLYRDSNNINIDGSADAHGGDDTTDGYIDNTSSRASAGSIGGSWIGSRGFLGLSINHLANNYGIPPGAHEHEHDPDHEEEEAPVRIDMQQTRYDVKGELNDPLAGFSKAKLRLAYVDYDHAEMEGNEVGTVFNSEALESRFELVHNPLNDWEGAIGVQILDRDFGAVGEEAFIPQSTINGHGLFIIEEKTFGDWLVELGGRYEQQKIDSDLHSAIDHDTYSLSAASQYQWLDNHTLNFSLSRAQRAPSIEELLSSGAHLATQSIDLGDTDLREETSNNWDIGYHYHGDIHLSVNLFYNHISDFIYKRNTGIEDPDEELMIYQYSQEDAVFKGVEAEISLPLSEQLQLRLFADTVRATLDNGGDVPRVTPSRIGTELTYSRELWDMRLLATRASSQKNPGEFEEETDGYTRLDAFYNVYLNQTMIFVRATNLLNEEIRHATSYLRDVAPEAERSLTVGVRYSF